MFLLSLHSDTNDDRNDNYLKIYKTDCQIMWQITTEMSIRKIYFIFLLQFHSYFNF